VVLASAFLVGLLTAPSFAQAPVVNPPTISSEPAFEGMITFRVTGTFTSPAGALGQPFTATVDIGGVISPVTVSGTDNPFTYRFSGGRAAGDHGTLPVIVSVTDKDGHTGTGTTLLTVFSVAPMVARVSPTTVNEALPTDFTLGFTHPGDGPGTTYSWSIKWGDGVAEAGTASGPGFFTRRHTYAARGAFDLQLFVVDKDGNVGSSTTTVNVVKVLSTVTTPIVGPTSTSASSPVTVDRAAPTVAAPAVSPTTTKEATVTTFMVTGTFTDPGGTTNQPFTATVHWGDGSTSAAAVSGAANPFAYRFDGSHTYAADGTYDVKVAVTGKDGIVGIGAPRGIRVERVVTLTTWALLILALVLIAIATHDAVRG
jgi:hypothetical protein